jgi:trehalose 6-phosphate synthase/phosphatase
MLESFHEGVNEFETRWIGWAGVNVPDEVGQRSLTEALAEKVHSIWSK